MFTHNLHKKYIQNSCAKRLQTTKITHHLHKMCIHKVPAVAAAAPLADREWVCNEDDDDDDKDEEDADNWYGSSWLWYCW